MSIVKNTDRSFLEAVARLTHCNPFLPERIECERQALAERFVDTGPIWHVRAEQHSNPNVERIRDRLEPIVSEARRRLEEGEKASPPDLRLYVESVIYWLYDSYEVRLLRLVEEGTATRRVPFYRSFRSDFERFLGPAEGDSATLAPAHLFACFYQVRRAFHLIFHNIIGGSMPTARLRASVWQSIFTRDMERYRRSLFRRLGDVTTLVTGPSGTGKELVAQSVGLARYVPFDPETERFAEDYRTSFYPLNLSALSPTLIESELFGHRRGAFTGAVEDRVGWLETCPAFGSVFLDEIGEVAPSIQVKLLRVLQTRVFQALGDTADRRFEGKIIAATNRDPAVEMREGRLREDLYYRLCSDLIVTPRLADQIADSPEELHNLVLFLCQRLAGESEARALAGEVEEWIRKELGASYPWPGNVRELEQCVRNVMIRGAYHPTPPRADRHLELARDIESGSLTADELLRRYVTLTYARAGSYQEAARRLALDRRTVKAKVDARLLEELSSG